MEIHNDIVLTTLRLINIILITLATAAWIVFYMHYKMISVIAPLSWLLHVLAYGVYRFFVPTTAENFDFMQLWTAILLMHNIVLLLILACLSNPVVEHKRKNKQ